MTDQGSAAICRLLLLFLLITAGTTVSANAADSPESWLMRMAESVEGLNYQGTLVHMHGGDADILMIVHRVEDGRVTERITAIDGAGREIIRDDDQVMCILPDKQAVIVEPRDAGNSKQSPLQGRLPRLDTFDQRYYSLSLQGDGSIAGRAAILLAVQPADEFRYGYRMWLDLETGMPLKTQLRDTAGTVLEQILFTEISIGGDISLSAVQPSASIQEFNWQRTTSSEVADGSQANWHWQATQLPAGFRPMAVRSKIVPGAASPVEQFVFTDGLATVSVFVESGMGSGDEGEGVSSMGAANAYTFRHRGHLITAVGEVPVTTVEMIAMSMRPMEPS